MPVGRDRVGRRLVETDAVDVDDRAECTEAEKIQIEDRPGSRCQRRKVQRDGAQGEPVAGVRRIGDADEGRLAHRAVRLEVEGGIGAGKLGQADEAVAELVEQRDFEGVARLRSVGLQLAAHDDRQRFRIRRDGEPAHRGCAAVGGAFLERDAAVGDEAGAIQQPPSG